MSIPNLIDKIKSKTNIDKTTIMYLLIIIGVGISSFGLGRLSVTNSTNDSKDFTLIKTGNTKVEISNTMIGKIKTSESVGKKLYVASKNGKMYYEIGCSGAQRIKEENKVWFSSKTDAEKSGYTLSSTCK